MIMTPKMLEDHAKELSKREQRLKGLTSELETIQNHIGQNGYAVEVNGVRVNVSEMDSRTYQSKMIRGREMIHLGALKAMQAMVDDAAQSLHEYRESIKHEIVA